MQHRESKHSYSRAMIGLKIKDKYETYLGCNMTKREVAYNALIHIFVNVAFNISNEVPSTICYLESNSYTNGDKCIGEMPNINGCNEGALAERVQQQSSLIKDVASMCVQ